jgi:hypothetical protein
MVKKNRRLYTVLLMFVLLCISGGSLFSQDNSASFNSNLYATIIPFKQGDITSITKVSDMSFGSITPSNTFSGMVDIDPVTGNVTSSNVILLPGLNRKSAEFSVRGKGNARFNINISPSTITLSNNQSTMELSLSNNGVNRLNNTGRASFFLGGTLTVNPNQPSGLYTGTITITIINN